MSWIFVSERLPEKTEKVVFACKNGMCYNGMYISYDGYSGEFTSEGKIFKDNVYAWMYLEEGDDLP